jgi:hypothetical protein
LLARYGLRDDGSVKLDSSMARFGSVRIAADCYFGSFCFFLNADPMKLFLGASEKFGQTLGIASKMKGYIDAAGFVNTIEKIWKALIREWTAELKMKELGH